MRAFFKGWKRKIGVVALVMACVFMAVWARSLSISDAILIPRTKPEFIRLDSRSGRLSWNNIQNEKVTIPTIIWRTDVIARTDSDVVFDHSNYVYEWRLHWGTIDVGRVHSPGDGRVSASYVIFHYLGFTIPLTLISLWLLLSKTRKSKQTKLAARIDSTSFAKGTSLH